MSNLKFEKPISDPVGYLSDGSWCSDFDDSPESSNNWEAPLSEDYSQEIKDNQINENLEAKLVNATYVNTQPVQCVSASSAANALPNEILTENLGAIPKRGFSYLNNELNQNIKNKVIIKRSPRRVKHLEKIKAASSDNSSQPLNLTNKPSNCQQSVSDKSDKSIKEGLQDSQKSNTTTPTPKIPRKLKPEAFSFLNKVMENQSSKETNINIFKGEYKKHFVPTAFVDEESLKRSLSPPKSPKKDKYECVDLVPTTPSLIDFQNNSDHSADHPSPTQVTNTNKFITKLQKQDIDITKPPLPDRPPPISKYPPGMFSQEQPRTLNIAKADQKQLILPTTPLKPSPIKIIPNTAKYSTGIDSNISFEIDEIHVPKPGGDTKFRKSSLPIANLLSNVKHFNMSERPLPPVPISLKSKVTQSNNIKAASEINKIEDVQIKAETATQINPVSSIVFSKGFHKQNLVSNSASEETVPILESVNAEDQTLKTRSAPDLKPKPRQRIDIIGHQTNVSSETFHSQHKISAAITARLQNLSSLKPINDSYEKPKNESAPSDLTDQEGCIRSLGLKMETRNAIALSREENNPISKRHSPVHTFSDLGEIQQSITRPCLPQKLRTTQRSVSCTSLVQTFKDMSFSIWNNNDKEKRRSEGRNSFESQTKNLPKDNTIFEKARPQEISKVSANDKETIPKVACREIKVDLNATTEKQVIARFAWYHHISAREAQHRLLALGEDGTFLIRPSSTPTDDIQYTTCVVYSGRVLNLHIRKKNGQYALGKEKTGEKTFSSLSDLIKYHQEMPIEIRPASRSSISQELIYVYLRVTPPK